MPKSLWTGRESNGLIAIGKTENDETIFVEPEHRVDLESHLRLSNKWKKTFLIFTISWNALLVALALTAQRSAIGIALIVLSIFLFTLPFATPQTTQFLGIQKSRLLVRGIAAVIAGIGVWVLLAG